MLASLMLFGRICFDGLLMKDGRTIIDKYKLQICIFDDNKIYRPNQIVVLPTFSQKRQIENINLKFFIENLFYYETNPTKIQRNLLLFSHSLKFTLLLHK